MFCKIICEDKVKEIDTLADCCWAMSYHSDQSNQIEIVINSGVVPHLIKFLHAPKLNLVIPALRILGNISAGNANQTEVLILNNIFVHL